MANPLVSVVIPVYNAAHFLPQAIGSVCAQEYESLEIIVVDDGSTDNCADVAKSLGSDVRYDRQVNRGPSAARNRGLDLARGEFTAFLDADDQWPAHKLSVQLGRLLAEPELDLVLGRIQYVALPGGEIPPIQFEGPENTLTHVHLGSGLYRRRAFERIGSFDESIRFCEDVDWFQRAREHGLAMRILRATTLLYRLHAENMTRDRTLPDRLLTQVLKRSLDRRRAGGGAVPSLAGWLSYDEWSDGAPALVTVVIPAYNAERHIAEALEGVLRQTYRPVEIVVVDDGSTDATAETVRRFGPRVRFATQANAGAGAARNRGVAMATGRYIAFLDADDWWPPEKLARQVEILEQNPGCDLVFGQVQQFVHGGKDLGGPEPGILPGTLLARREAFQRVGPLAEDLKLGEFIDWYARAREAGLSSRIESDVWLRRRIHEDNLGVRERASRGDYLRVLKAAMDRRRQSAEKTA
ncbi:MAG TPA: glycosyltransferase [Bryobacteraceae bacterium]|jgi:glycosyltransferase involved in cell wall biosynthesis|nr:glycosyltransferase [Bryobacteraceae bacterium]